jgi:hypothetical protein
MEIPRQKKINRLGRYFSKKRTSSPPKELKFPNLVASRQNEEMSQELSHQTVSMTRPSTPRPHKRTSKLSPMKRKLPRLRELTSTPGDLKNEIIDGTDYITFQPNTIVYAVPSDSKLAQMMLSAQVGIVFHTSYTGKTFSDMKASFNIDINRLATTKDVWFRDAYFVDASGTATFTEQETKNINYILSDLGNLFRGINPVVLNRIGSSETILTQVKTFNNSKVRAGQVITDTTKHVRELIRTIEDKLNKEILAAKRDDTKKKRITEKSELMRFYRNNATELKKIFDIQNGLVEAKSMIVKKLQQIQQVTGTFLRTDTGFKITDAEGFVAVDHIKGNAVKLVDRLEFSQANFNAAKAWSK